MGFLCVNREDRKNVDQKILANEICLRNAGLNQVNNLNPEINVCREIFLSPAYYVQGAVELYSGLTATLTGCTTGTTGIYNLDYTPNIDINFIITGGTEYTGYTGSFCIKTFSDLYFTAEATGNLIKGSEISNYCFDFSGITGTTIVKQFLEGSLSKNWSQYLIRPYYIFKSKECNPNNYFNSWESSVQLNGFQKETDYYFMTTVNPPTPVLSFPGGIQRPNYTLITDRLYVNGVTGPRGFQAVNNLLNYFILSSLPANGQILLILNGVQLTQGYDFDLITQGPTVPPIVEIKNNVIKTTDWLLATYITGGPDPLTTNFGVYFIDTILLDSFTSTSTPSYRTVGNNSLNYNPVTLKYEFFTTLPIDPSYSLIVTVNGVKMAEDFQYFKSTSFDGRIIFDQSNTNFQVGDVISVLAVSKDFGSNNNDYGTLAVNSFTAQWNVPTSFTNDTVTGRFIVQVFNDNTSILTNQLFVDYVPGQSNYTATFDNLSLNVEYRFRVTFEATYTGYLNNKVITCSYAEGYFDTTSAYINNTY